MSNYKFSHNHSCLAAVLTCIDFRFWHIVAAFIKTELQIVDFDFFGVPGAAKTVNDDGSSATVLEWLKVPCDLHGAKKIILVNHQDCGAYGGSANFADSATEQEFHATELRKAKAKITEKFPEQEVVLLYAKISDDKEKVEILTIAQ